MTTDHPDDELLSALLDREALPSDGASSGTSPEALTSHVATCLDCQGRLARLAEVVAAVAAPVPPPADDVREAAISAALAIQGSTDQAVGEVDPRVVVHAERRFARGRRLAGYLGAAAIVLALLAAVPLLARGSGSTKSASTAAALPSGAASGTTEAGPAATAASNPSPPFASAQSGTNGVANDLGAQSDATGLARSIGQRLAASATVPVDSSKSAVTSTPVAPTSLAAPAAAATTCESVATALAGGAGAGGAAAVTPLYSATLTWQGTAAEVFAFSTPVGRRAVVLSRAGCQLLQTLSL